MVRTIEPFQQPPLIASSLLLVEIIISGALHKLPHLIFIEPSRGGCCHHPNFQRRTRNLKALNDLSKASQEMADPGFELSTGLQKQPSHPLLPLRKRKTGPGVDAECAPFCRSERTGRKVGLLHGPGCCGPGLRGGGALGWDAPLLRGFLPLPPRPPPQQVPLRWGGSIPWGAEGESCFCQLLQGD